MSRVLLDTNVLLLFLVGNGAPDRLTWKRLARFDLADVLRLNREIGRRRHVSLPNILTEVSNFLGSGRQEAMPGAAALLAAYCLGLQEVYVKSSEVVADAVYGRLGLTDTAIYRMAETDTKVVTADYELAERLRLRGIKTLNLMHFKTPS